MSLLWPTVLIIFSGIFGERAEQPNHVFKFAKPILEHDVEPELYAMTASEGLSRRISERKRPSTARNSQLLTMQEDETLPLEFTITERFNRPSTERILKSDDRKQPLLPSSKGISTLHSERKEVPEIQFRPTLYKNIAENVSVNMQITKASYIDMQSEAAEFRFVLTTKWFDERIKNQVLFIDGQDDLTLNLEAATLLIWMPEIIVNNVDKPAVETTASVTVSRNGSVVKEQWMVVTTNQNLEATAYPFDVQTLELILVPRSLPAAQMMLYAEGDGKLNYNHDAFYHTDYTAISSQHRTVVLNQRSRYVLSIQVARKSKDLLPTIVVPNVLIAAMAYMSLFLPIGPGYASPRAGILCVPYIALTSLSNRQSDLLPKGKTSVWLWTMQKQMQGFMLWLFVFNVLNENAAKRNEDIARSLRKEMRIVSAMLIMSTFALLFMYEKNEATIINAILAMDVAAVLFVLSVAFREYYHQEA